MQSTFRRAALLVLALPTVAHAQLLVNTGADQAAGRDLRWEISTDAGASWADAFVVQTPPPQWTGGAPGGVWLGATASGSFGGGSYRLREQFVLGAGDALSFDLRCAFDNMVADLFINSVLVQFGGQSVCGPAFHVWGPMRSFSTASFVTGLNTIEFRWTGDNVTDGMAVQTANLQYTPDAPPTVVPEPSTWLLLATGLAGFAGRRRRVGSAA
jgi:hypothetical protein